uniref:ATP synthase F0 subunit 8 n=1 Tax=Abispa ephippium TaxID=485912 RepID=B6RQY2_9HYME|nr:ATP synthase F0 subunit 8 [Abispa ephippium]
MPHMSPMKWLNLFSSMIFIFSFLMLKIHFLSYFKPLPIKYFYFMKNINQFNWFK